MRWTLILWVLMSYAIFASSVTEAKRVQRDLTTIKKFVISNILGSGRRKCVGKSSRRKFSKGYEVFVVPERQNFILNAVSSKDKTKEFEATKNNDDRSFSNSLRWLLGGDILQVTYQGLRGIITLLQSDRENKQETNNVIKNQPKIMQGLSDDTIKLKLTSLPVVNEPKRTTNDYEINHIRQPLSSVVSVVTPIVTMPRKYSYEQTKGKIVEKFTLDKNFDVIVTRNPKVPRPEFVDDRVRDIILNMPLSSVKLANSYTGNEWENNILTKSTVIAQRDNIQTKASPEYFYVPPHNVQGFIKLTNKDSAEVNKDIKTRFMYKQETDNGFLEYNKTSNVSVGENGKIIVSKPPEYGNSVYTGKPIVVATIDDTSEVTNNYYLMSNNYKLENKSNQRKDQLRGDV